MKNMTRSRAVVMGMVLSMIISLCPVWGERVVYADPVIPVADETYNSSNVWSGTLPVAVNKTIKLSGVTLNDVNGPVISVENGVTLNLVIEGTNELSVDSKSWNACIEVPYGATLNIYGVKGASLTVTGGFISAGIGTRGVANHSQDHSPHTPGTINIYSGTITATGGAGDKDTYGGGAGIGSGARSDGGVISIYGGNVTAYGQEGGAGIGSGYCTSGGDNTTVYQSGSFTGGTISITGGTVRAASGTNINFDSINANDKSTYNNCNSFGAGIGGGYGSTSGTIVIGGDAKVTAAGFGGGAGIGAGRGTSKAKKYDGSCTPYDITIGGTATVKAYAGVDTREEVDSLEAISGAAIGGGRGFGTVGEKAGNIEIKENATVFADAGAYAQAIGSSVSVGVEIDKINEFKESDFSPPVTSKVETQCVAKIKAKVGGQAVQNVATYFNEVVTATPANTVAPDLLAARLSALAAATPTPAEVKASPSWIRDSGDYTIKIEENNTIDYNDFSGLFVDNKAELIEGRDFSKHKGSVVLVIKSSALKDLPSGNHTFSALFGNGKKVNYSFTVKNASYNYNDYDDDDDYAAPVVTSTDGNKKAPKTGEL